MTVLFALIPSLIALAIFVGTFRLAPPRPSHRPRPTASATRASPAIRSPLPLTAARRAPVGEQRLGA